MTARGRDTATVTPGADDRRFRRSRGHKAKGRARGRRAIPWRLLRRGLGGLLLLGVVGLLGHRLVASAHLQVQRIAVSGHDRLTLEEIEGRLEGLRGRHLLEVDLDTWRRRLLESPWVADARLRRVLPGTITVEIVERSPLAIARVGTDLFVVDERGAIIDDFGPGASDLDLPIVDGLSRGPREPGSREQARAALAARVLAALGPHGDLMSRVSQLDVRDSRDAIVMLEQDPVRLHLGERAFEERLRSYLELAPALRARVPAIDEVDLRFGPRVYVRPVAGETSTPGRSTPASP